KVLAVVGEKQTVRLLDTGTGKELNPPQGHEAAVHSVAFSRDGGTVTSVGEDAVIRTWEAAPGKEVGRVEIQGPEAVPRPPRGRGPGPGLGLGFELSPDHKMLVNLGEDGLSIRDAATGKELRKVQNPQDSAYVSGGYVVMAVFSPDGKLLAAPLAREA